MSASGPSGPLVLNCVIEDALINFLLVILIENAPNGRVMFIRENPGLNLCMLFDFLQEYGIRASLTGGV